MLLWGSRAAQFSTCEWHVWLAFFMSGDIKGAKGTAALLNWRILGNSLNFGPQECVLPVQSLLVLLCTISARQGPRVPWTHSDNSCDLRPQIYPTAPREESKPHTAMQMWSAGQGISSMSARPEIAACFSFTLKREFVLGFHLGARWTLMAK